MAEVFRGARVSDSVRDAGLYAIWLARVDRRIRSITDGAQCVYNVSADYRTMYRAGASPKVTAEIALDDWGFTIDHEGES
jgi:hypothetical protein